MFSNRKTIEHIRSIAEYVVISKNMIIRKLITKSFKILGSSMIS